jgi:mannose-6-phosphate isomerase-like protein (cupin superfamily)
MLYVMCITFINKSQFPWGRHKGEAYDFHLVLKICELDGESKEHVHEYDEYVTVVQGKYTLIIDGKRIDLCRGDEYFIPICAGCLYCLVEPAPIQNTFLLSL